MKNIGKIANYLLADSEDVFMFASAWPKEETKNKIQEPKEDPDLDPLIKTGLGNAVKIKKL